MLSEFQFLIPISNVIDLKPGMELSRAAGLISLLLWSFFSVSLAGGNETDRLSLLQLKANIVDPLGALNAWKESIPFCDWPGVECGRRHQRVIGLFLNSSKLGGHLSPFIGNMSFLRNLHLQNNSFSHKIPEEIGRLHRLQVMHLNNNSFNGNLPTNISHCFSLQRLALSFNSLAGEIPSEIGSLPNLEILSLGANNLRGKIPSSIANLSNTLKMLYLTENHLSGFIPSNFGQLKMMEILSLGRNKLTGEIPPLIYNLSLIQKISVESNELHGELPSHLGHMLMPKLEMFLFHHNQFSGLVPDISNASNIIFFEILHNRLFGKAPKFSNLPNLKILDIGENMIGSGEDDDLDFLGSLVNSSNLEVLGIDENNFGGKLPEYVGNFSTKLWYILFGRNRIKGSIPTSIGNLVNLGAIGFEENQMTGSMPSSLGMLQKLYGLNLEYNKLSGSIPFSFGNLTSLNQLYLGSNNLEGAIPLSLRDCKYLAELSLYGNNLNGSIPQEVVGLSFRILDLSHNHFTGSIPNEVGQLVNLARLDFSDNKLSGEIPKSLGMCEVLEYLSLGRNSLQGSIPQSFSDLKGLLMINLSYNNLFGKFPTYMENFRLQKVDFSFNNFEGELPTKGIFTNSSAIWVEGNPRLCGGVAGLGLPKCPSKPKNNHNQSSKIIVSAVCGLIGMLLLALLSWLLLRTRKRIGNPIVGSPLGVSFFEISYKDLRNATNGFCGTNLIGAGSFGSVFKANILTQNKHLTVAVKVLNLQVSRGFKSFISECKILGSIKHRNVVKLLTACSSIDFQGNDFKALVYEFVINGSLEEWLHPRDAQSSEQGRHLDFIQRINIAINIANALDHLHNNSHLSIVHSDIKPSNILLDSDMVACVGDFGLARFLEDPSRLFSSDQSNSIEIRGSIGYIAPEYSMGGEVSRAGDVYSYGILLLEMFTGKCPTDEMFRDSFNLHNFVKKSLPERLSQITDLALLVRVDQIEERRGSIREASYEHNNGFWNCLQSILDIGVSCSEERPNERMSIDGVVKELHHIKIAYTSNRIGG